MTRTRKAPEERRSEIVDHALRLFAAQGLDATSVNDIVRAAGVSKGGFYHHFANKHEVVSSIVDRLNRATLARLDDIAQDTALAPREKLDAFFSRSVETKTQAVGQPLLERLAATIYDPKNLALRATLETHAFDMSLPYLSTIIVAGQRSGDFDVDDAAATARHVLLLGTAVTAHAMRAGVDTLAHDLAVYRRHVDRLLGVTRKSS